MRIFGHILRTIEEIKFKLRKNYSNIHQGTTLTYPFCGVYVHGCSLLCVLLLRHKWMKWRVFSILQSSLRTIGWYASSQTILLTFNWVNLSILFLVHAFNSMKRLVSSFTCYPLTHNKLLKIACHALSNLNSICV